MLLLAVAACAVVSAVGHAQGWAWDVWFVHPECFAEHERILQQRDTGFMA